MVNYSLGKIYKITGGGLTYIGSTCVPRLCARMAQHRIHHKFWIKTGTKYCTSFLVLVDPAAVIELLESCPCANKDELHVRERYYMDHVECVNQVRPIITAEEEVTYQANHYRANRDRILERAAEHYMANKDRILAQCTKYRNANKDRISVTKKEYRSVNKDRIDEYRSVNKDRIREQRNDHYRANKGRIIAKGLEYYSANKDRILERAAEHYRANKDSINARRRAKRLAEGTEASTPDSIQNPSLIVD